MKPTNPHPLHQQTWTGRDPEIFGRLDNAAHVPKMGRPPLAESITVFRPKCCGLPAYRSGRISSGKPRFQCRKCRRTWTEHTARIVGAKYPAIRELLAAGMTHDAVVAELCCGKRTIQRAVQS